MAPASSSGRSGCRLGPGQAGVFRLLGGTTPARTSLGENGREQRNQGQRQHQ